MGTARQRIRGRKPVGQMLVPGANARELVKFCGLFLALVAVLLVALEEPIVWKVVREPYCSWLAGVCAGLLRSLSIDAVVEGNRIVGRQIHIEIVRSCDGLSVMSILAAAILVFPATWRSRLLGVALGWPVLFLLNIVRLVVLCLLRLYSYTVFSVVHVYVFQVSLVTVAVVYFLWWAQTGRPPLEAESGPVRR